MKLAADSGVEMIELSDAEKNRWNDAIADTVTSLRAQKAGSMTVGAVIDMMQGK